MCKICIYIYCVCAYTHIYMYMRNMLGDQDTLGNKTDSSQNSS